MKHCLYVVPLCWSALIAACRSAPPEPTSEQKNEPKAAEPKAPPQSSLEDQRAAAGEAPRAGSDPLAGKFSLAQATQGLAGKGKLVAELLTDKGKLECELLDDKAPITVANFVGLARGIRPWKSPSGEWVKKPAYDGTVFHRVIKGFMIQGGDPEGSGSGEPGYVIPDEVWGGAHHDEPGLLCMANRGRNTNGAQFFILDGSAPHLDGGYTIFGRCKPVSVVRDIASVPVRGDKAVEPPKIQSVSIRRQGKN
ncbi:MAG TPA: peptidylprolyl isomerase [Polyangiaceae bacterium]|jgi:peptidyl-prolyl cis-trans isomerase A (cyclophilin A)